MISSGWQEVGENAEAQGEFVRWDTPGTQFEGRWLGAHEGLFGGLVGALDTGDGEHVRFKMTTVLLDKLGEVKPGTVVRIRYTGLQKAKSGRDFKRFSVQQRAESDGEPTSGTAQ